MIGRTWAAMLIAGIVASAAAQSTNPAPEKNDEQQAKTEDTPQEQPAMTAEKATGPLDFSMTNIEGKDVPLTQYKGKVVLIVNVASRCGLTPQYEQLQELHDKYAEQGLAILAFPANDFMKQEPGTNLEIKQFCQTRFGVEFDLFAKIAVRGKDMHELYKFLTSKKLNEKFGGPIKWNFTKFLIDRDGKVVNRFEPRVKPDAPEAIAAIEAALAAKPEDDK